ncbi:MAG: MotA/TolQ/ExbB proton channel family protein [Coraliomargarita sp.]
MNTICHYFNLRSKQFLTLVGGMFFAVFAHAQDAAPEIVMPPEESVTLWSMFQQGGWAMYPLVLFSVATVGLVVYCAMITREKRFLQPEADADLNAAIEAADAGAGLQACAQHPGYVTDIMQVCFSTVEEGHRSVVAVNEAMEERANKVLAAPLVFVQYLQVVASVSPMVGLLGTVSGMVKAFRNIAAQGLGKPELLANNISEALVTTATGLIVAIPALMAYFYFKNKYASASSGIYEHIGLLTRRMVKHGMLTESKDEN